MQKQKQVAAIHDISGFGRCSLTVALPILSACGIHTACLPTALLSTHTGGLEGWSFLDLAGEMGKFTAHWAGLGLRFDGIYSGYLGGLAQIERLEGFLERFGGDEVLTLIDPAMADGGRRYSSLTPEFAARMTALCSRAHIITPNLTEAAMMLGECYREGPYSEGYIERLLRGLLSLGPRQVVLTGVWFDETALGAACIDCGGKISYTLAGKLPGTYHGTGDIFASVLCGALLRDWPLPQAIELAVRFTCRAIGRTHAAGTDTRFGVNFEAGMADLAAAFRG